MQHAVLTCSRNKLPVPRIEHRNDSRIPVMLVIGPELMPPLELSCTRVEGDERVGEQIGSRTHGFVEVRTGIAHRNEQRVRGTVKCKSDPHWASSVLCTFGTLPRLCADLIASWRHIEAPSERSVFHIERHDGASDAPIAPGLPDEDKTVPNQRRGAHTFANRPVSDLPFPEKVPGFCVQCVDSAILRAANYPAVSERHALVGGVHLWPLGDVLVAPQTSTAGLLDCVRAKVRRRVQYAVIDDGPGLESAKFAELHHANRPQLARRIDVQIGEWRVAVALVAFVVHQPAGVGFIRAVELRLCWLVGARLLDRASEFPKLDRSGVSGLRVSR